MDGWSYKWYDAGGADAGHRWRSAHCGLVCTCCALALDQQASATKLQETEEARFHRMPMLAQPSALCRSVTLAAWKPREERLDGSYSPGYRRAREVLIAFRIPRAGLAEASGLISAGGLGVESILAAEDLFPDSTSQIRTLPKGLWVSLALSVWTGHRMALKNLHRKPWILRPNKFGCPEEESVQVVALTQCAFVVRPGAAINLSLIQAWPSPPFLQATRKVASASASPFEIPSVPAGVLVGTTCKLCVSLSVYHYLWSRTCSVFALK
ncbi:unnamed protein product [Cladocopium goreaui]|uniref:Uncharacterized protein n=1 Tax=Cladocopium goreaui TaxID=2562237 RepID=A0A9P1GDX6_9DINO|nr:unnamed protein product [Cladocopium goreaui]